MDGESLKTTTPPATPKYDISAWDTRFFGHPRGLATCFFTEMWERFSYYGTRALLILFMTASVTSGGLGMPDSTAGSIYGLYTAMVYLLTLPGGWVADRLMGQRKTVFWGGILIAAGNFCLAVPGMAFFYSGLTLIVLGTGLLKPNVSTMVGALYRPDDNRRDAGFSIFYMGINIGALISPLICGYLGEQINWHYGFLAAGVGMVLGLIQYSMGAKYLGEAGLHPAPAASAQAAEQDRRRFWMSIGVVGAIVLVLAVLSITGLMPVSAQGVADAVGYLLAAVVVIFFGWLLFGGNWTPVERKRFIAILVLFFAAALFWSAFEQAGSTLNLFAERDTDRHILGYEYPASWFQSVNSIFIILLAPVLAWLWVRLGPKEPSSPAKFALGLVFVGAGFAVMIVGALRAQQGVQVSSIYLWLTYLLHTIGELCLSPVGLSAMTKLAPVRVVGLMMGVWFLAASVGNYIGGRLASVYGSLTPPTLFTIVAVFCIAFGLIMALFTKPMKNLMGGVK